MRRCGSKQNSAKDEQTRAKEQAKKNSPQEPVETRALDWPECGQRRTFSMKWLRFLAADGLTCNALR